MITRYWRSLRIRTGLAWKFKRRPPGRHRAPKRQAALRPPIAALPPAMSRHDDTVPLAVLLDPDTTLTTELPAPVMYRTQETG